MRSEEETRAALDRHGDMVRRLCLVHLKNQADTEDVFQTVFLRYVLSPQVFTSEEHEKAWLIRVTVNACRDLLRSWARSRRASLEEALDLAAPPDQESREVLAAVLSLPEKYREVIHLFYYEDYSVAQIGRILKKNESTVRSLLYRARKMLKEYMKEGWELD